jgi:hypothetical protein
MTEAKRRAIHVVLAAAVGTALAVGASPSILGFAPRSAAAGGFAIVKIAKHADGPYKFGIVNLHLDEGAKKSVYIKARSQSGEPEDALLLEATTPDSEYKVKYFRGPTNISGAVKGSGYTFILQPHFKRFRAKVKATGPPGPDCLSVDVQVGMQANRVSARLNGGSCPV